MSHMPLHACKRNQFLNLQCEATELQ